MRICVFLNIYASPLYNCISEKASQANVPISINQILNTTCTQDQCEQLPKPRAVLQRRNNRNSGCLRKFCDDIVSKTACLFIIIKFIINILLYTHIKVKKCKGRTYSMNFVKNSFGAFLYAVCACLKTDLTSKS